MSDDRFELITPIEHPDYEQFFGPLSQACWPELMLHDPVAVRYWGDLYTRCAEY